MTCSSKQVLLDFINWVLQTISKEDWDALFLTHDIKSLRANVF